MCLIGVLGMAFSASAVKEEVYLGQVEAGVYKQFIVDVYYQYDSTNDKNNIEQIKSIVDFKSNGDQLLIGSTVVSAVENYLYTVKPKTGWYWDSGHTDSRIQGKFSVSDKKEENLHTLYREGEGKSTLRVKFTDLNIVWIEIVDANICTNDCTYYFGVSRLDACRETPVSKQVELHDFKDRTDKKCTWQSVTNGSFADKTTNPTDIRVKTKKDENNDVVPVHSTNWKGETVKGNLHGQNATTNFTIIAVDVKLGGLAEGLAEGKEETEGLLMTTNTPKEVTFKVLTKNLPASLDCYRIECDDLYQKSSKSEYDKAPLTHMIVKVNNATTYYKRFDTDKTYKLKDLTSTAKPFYVICTEPSREWNKSSVTFTHVLSGASDKANYTCCGLAFITPSGSPEKYETDKNGKPVVVNPNAAEPADRYCERAKNEENNCEDADGQNEFCFSKSGQKLTVRFKVGILPQPPAEKLDAMLTKFLGSTRTGTFTVKALRDSSGDGTPVWESNKKRTLSNKVEVTKKDGVFADEVVYSGYPTKNNGFGKYTVTFEAGKVKLSADYEVFYDKYATDHPSCSSCKNCPNWFYYWKQGAVPGLKNVKFAKSDSDVYKDKDGNPLALNPYGVHIHNEKIYNWNEERNGITVKIFSIKKTRSEMFVSELAAEKAAGEYPLRLGLLPVGKHERFCGVAFAAAACAHEERHKHYYELLIAKANDYCAVDRQGRVTHYGAGDTVSVDTDKDGIADYLEMDEMDIGSKVNEWDTFNFHSYPGMGAYESCGDDEIRARKAERTAYNYDIFQDWAMPGCQSQIPFGPTEY